MWNQKPACLLLSALFCCWVQVLQAHDFWLEAHPFYQQEGKKIGISIHVGTDMMGDPLPNIPAWYEEFSSLSADGRNRGRGEWAGNPPDTSSRIDPVCMWWATTAGPSTSVWDPLSSTST